MSAYGNWINGRQLGMKIHGICRPIRAVTYTLKGSKAVQSRMFPPERVAQRRNYGNGSNLGEDHRIVGISGYTVQLP